MATKPSMTPPDPPKDVTPDLLAALFARASGLPVTEGMIRSDIAAGAPVRPDGTINFIRYTAWLLKNERPD